MWNVTEIYGAEGNIEQMKPIVILFLHEDGYYYAVREENPKFCLRGGRTLESAASVAERALHSYKEMQDKKED